MHHPLGDISFRPWLSAVLGLSLSYNVHAADAIVVVFSDHMNAYHTQMEHVMIDGEALLSETHPWAKFNAQAGVLAYLADALKARAPQALQSDADFQKLIAAVAQSVRAVVDAGQTADSAAARKAIAALKGPYSKLFARFG